MTYSSCSASISFAFLQEARLGCPSKQLAILAECSAFFNYCCRIFRMLCGVRVLLGNSANFASVELLLRADVHFDCHAAVLISQIRHERRARTPRGGERPSPKKN